MVLDLAAEKWRFAIAAKEFLRSELPMGPAVDHSSRVVRVEVARDCWARLASWASRGRLPNVNACLVRIGPGTDIDGRAGFGKVISLAQTEGVHADQCGGKGLSPWRIGCQPLAGADGWRRRTAQ